VVPRSRTAQALGLFGAANIFMNALAPALMEPLAAAAGYRYTFVVAGALAVAGWALAARLAPAPPRAPAPAGSPLGPLLADARLRQFILVLFVTGLAASAAFTFIAPFALERGITAISPFFVAFTTGALVVRVGGGRLVDRLGPRRVALASVTLYGVVIAALAALAPGRLAPLALVFGLVQGAFFPSSMALAVAAASPPHRGKILVLANGAFSAGAAAVLPLGWVAAPIGYGRLFVILGATTFASALLLWRTLGRSAPQDLEPQSRRGR
jgi:predicted MFS family arabinose efflux permease